MKLLLQDKFTLEIPKEDGTFENIDGSLRKLLKNEEKQLKLDFKEIEDLTSKGLKLVRKTNKLIAKKERYDKFLTEENVAKIDIIDEEIDSLEKEIDTIETALRAKGDSDIQIKKRLELSLGAENKERILQLCQTHGYSVVFSAIEEGIAEKKPKE